MLDVIVLTTAELVGAASGATWSAEWSFGFESGKLKGEITVETTEESDVHFSLVTVAPWVHAQWVTGSFDFALLVPPGGGGVDHIPDEPVWALNGNTWLVQPMSMGSSGAGYVDFDWSPPGLKYVPAGTLRVDANWTQSANMSFTIGNSTGAQSWDLNENGSVGIADLMQLLTNWGNPWGLSDLIGLLSAWGA